LESSKETSWYGQAPHIISFAPITSRKVIGRRVENLRYDNPDTITEAPDKIE
jgi:hypothetical protein